jgi:hypothetical protein
MNNTTTIIHKGEIVAVQVVDKEVWFHHQSPTGDSSDYSIMRMECLNTEQALVIARYYGEKLGLDPLFFPSN